ncbi:hypothetical protein [Parendozoicomonas haliclonae]|nr:hypothetical protein [Parendozoicomonas haliclonae]
MSVLNASARELGLRRCVTSMWYDSDKIIGLLEQFEDDRRSQGGESDDGEDEWMTVRAYEKPEMDFRSEVQMCSGSPCKNPMQEKSLDYVIDVNWGFMIPSTPKATPLNTPVPTPRPVSSSAYVMYPSPIAPLSDKREDFPFIASPLSVTQHRAEVGGPESVPPNNSPDMVSFESQASVSSDSLSPQVLPGVDRQGILFIRRLGQHESAENKSLLKSAYDKKRAAEMSMICNVMERSGDPSGYYYYLCCAFEGLEKTPDLVSLVKNREAGTSKSEKRENKKVIKFFSEIERQYERKMMKVGDLMHFVYKGRNIAAKIVGVGTSTVVFRFETFDGDDSDEEINSLNKLLPEFAFRRITFTNKMKSEVFWFHQLAQISFLNEHDVDILPVKIWTEEDAVSVFIAQPYLEEPERLEYYFQEISQDATRTRVNVNGADLSIEDFLTIVTNEIVSGIKKLSKINSDFTLGREGRTDTKVMEGFLDAKYPNYAVRRNSKTGRIELQYFDLFPAHLRLFERHPMDSNGHTQYEIFDTYFQRGDGEQPLISNGMVGAYKKKYVDYNNPEKMLMKLGASGVELIFDGVDYKEARDVLINRVVSPEMSHRMSLVEYIVGRINSAAKKYDVKSSITFEKIVDYWDRRVKTNMLLRLALNFLEEAQIMSWFELKEASQLMSSSTDEDALLAWAKRLYQDDEKFKAFMQAAHRGEIQPDPAIKLFQALVERYSTPMPEDDEQTFVKTLYPLLAERRINQRPIGVSELQWQEKQYLKQQALERAKQKPLAPPSLLEQHLSPELVFALQAEQQKQSFRIKRPAPGSRRKSGTPLGPPSTKKPRSQPAVTVQVVDKNPVIAISGATSKTHNVALTALASQIASVKKLTPDVPDGSLGLLITHGLRPFNNFITRPSFPQGMRRYDTGGLKHVSTAPYMVRKLGPETETFSRVVSEYGYSVFDVLGPVMSDIERKNEGFYTRQAILSALSGLPRGSQTSGDDGSESLIQPQDQSVIKTILVPMTVCKQFEQTIEAALKKYRNHEFIDQQDPQGEIEFLQKLAVSQDVKIVIENTDVSGAKTIYWLEAYKLTDGVWAALYDQVDSVRSEASISAAQFNKKNWIKLSRVVTAGQHPQDGLRAQWSMTGSSYKQEARAAKSTLPEVSWGNGTGRFYSPRTYVTSTIDGGLQFPASPVIISSASSFQTPSVTSIPSLTVSGGMVGEHTMNPSNNFWLPGGTIKAQNKSFLFPPPPH